MHTIGNAALAYRTASVGHRIGQNLRDKKPPLSETTRTSGDGAYGKRLSVGDLCAVAEGRNLPSVPDGDADYDGCIPRAYPTAGSGRAGC